MKVAIWHLRRPQLRDRADNRVLETAANSGTTHIVTLQPSSAIETALAEKVAAPQQQEIFTKPAARADKARFLDVLRRIGAEPPRPNKTWSVMRQDKLARGSR